MQKQIQLYYAIHQVDFGDSVEQLRTLIYDYVHRNPGEIDIVEVQARIAPPGPREAVPENGKRIDDWMLKRLLIAAKVPLDPKSAFDKFLLVFEFRSQHRVSRLTLSGTIPTEFFPLSIFLSDPSLTDREGNRLFIIRAKYYRRLPQMDELIKRAGLYLMEAHDREFEAGHFAGVTLLVDMQDNDYTQANLDLLRFAIKVGLMYAGPIKAILIYNLPWAFTFFLRMVESTLALLIGYKLQIFHLVNDGNLGNFVDQAMLPTFLKGTKVVAPAPPPDALPFEQFIELHEEWLEPKNARRIGAYLREIM